MPTIAGETGVLVAWLRATMTCQYPARVLTATGKNCENLHRQNAARQFPLRRRCLVPKSVDEVLTIGELSRYLKISKSTLYKLAQEGSLPGQKVGKHWRFRKEAIDVWLEARLTNPRRAAQHGKASRGRRP